MRVCEEPRTPIVSVPYRMGLQSIRPCHASLPSLQPPVVRYGEHILPIYDNDEDVRHVVWMQEQLLGEPVPVYWRVRPAARAQPYSWQQLLLDDKFFLRTTTGELRGQGYLRVGERWLTGCSWGLCVRVPRTAHDRPHALVHGGRWHQL